MLTLKKVAITGGLASGKSVVCQFFQELGAIVVSADALAHQFLSLETEIGQKILQLFGSEVLHEGQISRRILAEKVFQNPQQLEALEHLLHPAILHRIDQLYEEALRQKKQGLFIVEIPLLYEIQAQDNYDIVIAVQADEAVAKGRLKQAGFQPRDYDRRMSRQLPPSLKTAQADYTLVNNGSLGHLRQEVIKLNSILQKEK